MSQLKAFARVGSMRRRVVLRWVVAITGAVFALSFGWSAKGQEPLPGETLRIDTNLISVPVIVSDRDNRYVPSLKLENFKVFDNTEEQRISFFDAAEEPLNIVVMLDTSGSTSGVLDDIKKAAK